MDFFEAQERAKRRTQRLVLLFILAVLGTILASYACASLFLGQSRNAYDEPALTFVWDPQLFFSVTGIVLGVVGLASLYKWSQMRHGGSAVAEMVGGRRLNPRTTDLRERRLLNVVEEMAIASGVPVPAVYVLDSEPGINAFAAGLTTADAAVAVTRGTLEKLNRDELQAVIAHEFSHILNGDMRLNVKLTAIVFGILVIGLIGRGLLRSLGRGRIRTGGGKNKGGGIALLLAVGLALLIIGYIGYFFGRLIQAAVSRQREFLADASAVQFTRNPLGITGALKKIGGYALGSSIESSQAAQFSHFFFAQGFRSMFGGLWATHPPLPERIRAIEPSWDGKLFEPPELVDISKESFSSGAGFSRPPATREPDDAAVPPRIPFQAGAVVANIGALTEQHLTEAQARLASLPPALRDATRDAATAQPLVYALLIVSAPRGDDSALALVQQHSSATHAATTRELLPHFAAVDVTARLPLLQLALPALRSLDRAAMDRFATTLDEITHADGHVTAFEFALQKLLLRQLSLAQKPVTPVRFHAFAALANDFAVMLSALARADARIEAGQAFDHGAAQLPLLRDQIKLLPLDRCTLVQLDEALDRIASSALPIRQRALVAAAHVIGADGTVSVEEGELYRALAAVLDCPAPSLTA